MNFTNDEVTNLVLKFVQDAETELRKDPNNNTLVLYYNRVPPYYEMGRLRFERYLTKKLDKIIDIVVEKPTEEHKNGTMAACYRTSRVSSLAQELYL